MVAQSSHWPAFSFCCGPQAVTSVIDKSDTDEPLKLIIAGAPASGKGTQCELIKENYGVTHLSTGDMLRAAVAAGSEVGILAKEYMDAGKLVPDEVIIGVVSTSQNKYGCYMLFLHFRLLKWFCGSKMPITM